VYKNQNKVKNNMKKLLIIFLIYILGIGFYEANAVEFLNGTGFSNGVWGGTGMTGVTYPGFTYDVLQDFEGSIISPWSETDGSSILNPHDSNAKYLGSYGMSVATGSTSLAYVDYTFTPAKSSFSMGMWFKSGTYAAWAGDRWIIDVHNDAQGNLIIVKEGNSAGDDSRRVMWTVDGDVVAIADATWYWITLKFVKNGTSTCAVYNTSGTQIGSTMSFSTTPDFDCNTLQIITYGTETSTAVYYDDVYIDWTNAVFPLGPPTGS
jgi:hypothetical protein